MVYLKDSKIQVKSAEEVAKVFQDVFALEDPIEQDKEHFYVMHLNIRCLVKMMELVTIGGLTSTEVYPRETFRRAVMAGSAAIIIAHNHPSGEPDPSDEDTMLTTRIFEAGKLLGIDMLDHVIFTKNEYWSFKKESAEGGDKRMSAYMVKDETINRVVEWLYCEVGKSPYLQEQLEKAVKIDTSGYQWYVQLGQDMFQLNIAGVNARYGAGEAERFRELNYTCKPAHDSEIQVLKSLQCWLYQCMEGDVVKRLLYTFFRGVVEPHLMSRIINDLPEYTKAVWG